MVNDDAPSADTRNLFIVLDQLLGCGAEASQKGYLSNRHKWIRPALYIMHCRTSLSTSIFYLLQSSFGYIW